MFKALKENTLTRIKQTNPKTILLYVLLFFASSLFLGTLIRYIVENISSAVLKMAGIFAPECSWSGRPGCWGSRSTACWV